jgi:hypothetical protein
MGGDALMYVWPSQIFSALLLGTHHLNTSLVWAPRFGHALHKEPAKNCEFLESLYKGPFSVKVIDSPVVCQSLHEGCHQWSSFPTQLNCLFPSSSCSVQTGQQVANKGYSKQSLLNTPPPQNFKLLTSQNHIWKRGRSWLSFLPKVYRSSRFVPWDPEFKILSTRFKSFTIF